MNRKPPAQSKRKSMPTPGKGPKGMRGMPAMIPGMKNGGRVGGKKC